MTAYERRMRVTLSGIVLCLSGIALFALPASAAQFTLIQGSMTQTVEPIQDTTDVVSFYDYRSDSGHTPYMEDEVSKIYLYEDPLGHLSLVMHHSIDDSQSGYMRMDFDFEGIPAGAYVAVSDDPSHTWPGSHPSGVEFSLDYEIEGVWEHYYNSDGGVLAGLPTDKPWCMTINPDFIAGIERWDFVVSPTETIDLDMSEPLQICFGKEVSVDIKPETINLQSKGVFTAFIELPEGYDEEDVDISTLECEGAPAVKATMADDNKLVVKFDTKDLVGVSPGDDVVFTLTGMLTDGTIIIGTDTVDVIDNTKQLITDVVRDGVTDGQPTIVPGGLQEGAHAFMDRPLDETDTRNYHWENIPAELVGADYVMTYNEDKQPGYAPKVYNVSYVVTLGKAAKLYIFVDERYAPFPWLTDGSAGAVFVDTGLDIMLNEVGGREVLQPYDIYGAEVPAGTYILGPSCDGSGSRSFYSIAAAKK